MVAGQNLNEMDVEPDDSCPVRGSLGRAEVSLVLILKTMAAATVSVVVTPDVRASLYWAQCLRVCSIGEAVSSAHRISTARPLAPVQVRLRLIVGTGHRPLPAHTAHIVSTDHLYSSSLRSLLDAGRQDHRGRHRARSRHASRRHLW